MHYYASGTYIPINITVVLSIDRSTDFSTTHYSKTVKAATTLILIFFSIYLCYTYS